MLGIRWTISDVNPCGFDALAVWLADDDPESSLVAGDVPWNLGQFDSMCGLRALDSGIHGSPPGFDLETRVLDAHTITVVSELDEQAGTSTVSRPSVCAHATGTSIAQSSIDGSGSTLSCTGPSDR
jgi:hypothetical protein